MSVSSFRRSSFVAGLLMAAVTAVGGPSTSPDISDPTTLSSPAAAPSSGMTLWYQQPARMWTEALPVGNAHLGAMVYGGIATERLQLNEDTLWDGYPIDRINPNAIKVLPEVRRDIFEGKTPEATKLIAQNMMGVPARIRSYQTLGNLNIDSPDIKSAANYRRSLDLSTGVASTKYTVDGTNFTREVFASHPDDVIVLHLAADKPGQINLSLSMARDKDAQASAENHTLTLKGQIMAQYVSADKKPWGPVKPGMKFAGQTLVLPSGGQISTSGSTITVSHADALTLLIAAGTDYQPDGTLSGQDPGAAVSATLAAAAKKSYDQLKSDHLADFEPLMSRVSLYLGQTPAEVLKLPTDQRLARLKHANPEAPTEKSDPDLLATYFQLGRYLLASSSRPGPNIAIPANLQGLWCKEFDAPWNSNYTNNINIEMNYWPAEVANLSECHLPLFNFMERLAVSGAKTARAEYGAAGWTTHHVSDVFLCTTPCDGPQGLWPMGSAWLALHPWEHYAFTGDKQFLAERAYPLMKGAAEFILDYLVPAPEGTACPGKLVTNPSFSPENKYIAADGSQASFSYASTMDLEIIHDLLVHTIDATKILNIDADFRAKCEKALGDLAPLQIGPDGRLQEWVLPYKEQDIHHRHTSHLFGVYPGEEITLTRTPDLAKAAEKSLEVRGDKGATEWSLAWRTAIWARFGDGNHAYHMLDQLLDNNLFPNLFNRYSGQIFQIDGNFGATAALAEMLLQSQGDRLQLLPALPAAWPTGHVTGLRARGGFTVDISWKDGKLTEAKVLSTAGGPMNLQFPSGMTASMIMDPPGGPGDPLPADGTKIGTTYIFKPQ